MEIDEDEESRHVRENVPVTREEVVVEQRTFPNEELVVKKQEVVENEMGEFDLRRER